MVLLNQREGNKALSQNREQDMKTYKEMYEEAAAKTNGEYKGYTKGNALSLYVDEKYGVNADTIAACYLENSLNQGKTVSIPSLWITIKEPSGNAITCKNTRK
jgi:hypothetical protein